MLIPPKTYAWMCYYERVLISTYLAFKASTSPASQVQLQLIVSPCNKAVAVHAERLMGVEEIPCQRANEVSRRMDQ